MLKFYYTTGFSGTNNHYEQKDPSQSLGGAWSTTEIPIGSVHSIFGPIKSSHVNVKDYRAIIIKNSLTGSSIQIKISIANINTPALQVGFALEPEIFTEQDDPRVGLWNVVTAGSSSPAIETSLTWFTAPSGTSPVINLGAGQGLMLWIRNLVQFVPDIFQAGFDIVIRDDNTNNVITTIPVLRENERFYELTEPYRVQLYEVDEDIFSNLEVDYSVEGYARVSWKIKCPIHDSYPYLFQLLFSRVGTSNAHDWVAVGPPTIPDGPFLIDPQKRLHGMGQNVFYRVKLITGDGKVYLSKPVTAYGKINLEKLFIYREMLRKEAMTLKRFSGIAGILLRVRRYGPICSNCVDPTLREVSNSQCEICYGTGILGGYAPPVYGVFIDTSFEPTVEHVEHESMTGMQDEAAILPGRMAALYPVQTRDVWINDAADKRYYIFQVKPTATYQGMPISYALELRLANRKDIIYKFPIPRPLEYTLPPWQRYCIINPQ